MALSSVAVRPILRPVWPCTDDLAFHLLRLTQLDHLLRQGVLYSRWAPDMAQGYGFPFFNFYAPLSSYLGAAVSLPGLGLAWGLRVTFALCVIAAGLAAYRLARDHFSRPAAVAAAVAYMYAPYQGYDIYFRGNLAEAAAWPFLALALWTMGRLARQGGWGWLALAGLSYAAVLLTHNVFALIFSPLLALYGLLLAAMTARESHDWRPLLATGGALALGLGLSAFFWLPAMLERSLVHSDRLLVPPDFVYWTNFIAWRELLSWPLALRPDWLNPAPPRALGAVPVLLALPALAWLRPGRRPAQRRQVIFFGGALLVYALLMTAVSKPIWDRVPLMAYIQFPWRLLGPAALCLALLLAAAVDGLPRLWRGRAALGMIAVLVLTALFWFHPRYCPGLEQPTVADIQLFERLTGLIGTTAKGEYLPRTVSTFPAEAAEALFTASGLPVGAEIISQSSRGTDHTVVLEAAFPGTVTANIFYYPGWRVWVNGQAVPVTPSPEYGLMTFPVGNGRQEIVIRFGETALRLAANLLSAMSLLAVAGLAGLSWRQKGPRVATTTPRVVNGWRWTAAAIVLGLVLLLAAGWLLPRRVNLFYRPGLPDVAAVSRDHVNQMRLLQVAGWPSEQPADQPLRFDLYWTPLAPPPGDYQVTLVLLGPDGQRWSDGSTERPRDFRPAPPTYTWQPGQYALDSHLLTSLPGTPPGRYGVEMILFDRGSLQPVATTGGALGVMLGEVELGRPLTAAALPAQYAASARWDGIELTGYSLDRAAAAPGDPFLLTTFWQAAAVPGDDWLARLTLLDPTGAAAWQADYPLARADFPPTRWQAGDRWRGQQPLRLPARLASGEHRWQLQLCRVAGADCQPAGMTADLGMVTIKAPTRLWTAPEMTAVAAPVLGNLAKLVGGNWPATLSLGEALPVELIWRAEAETAVSYAVFLHLLGPNGQLIAQHDGEPAYWSRPTTGWLPGEFIPDGRILPLPPDLPAGTYTLMAGLYDPETGQRLMAPDGAPDGTTAVTVTTFIRD